MDQKYTETKIVNGRVQLKGALVNYPYPQRFRAISRPGDNRVFECAHAHSVTTPDGYGSYCKHCGETLG